MSDKQNSYLKYILTEKATLDLEEIWVYTFKNWSKEQADFYYHNLVQSFEYIVKNPNSKRIKVSSVNAYFIFKTNSHLIYFKINKPNNCIEIIRILHERMDENKQLKNQL